VDTDYKKEGSERSWNKAPPSHLSGTFALNILFIGGRLESSPISHDEPTMLGEEPPQREARRRRNRRRNIRRHHEAGERDPVQPVSRDEVSEVGETPDERVSEKGGILTDVTAGKLKTENENKLNRVQGYAERTLSLLKTEP
jgi:hypothetical protein